MSIKALQEYTRIAKYAQYLPEHKRRETWAEQVTRMFDMHRKKFAHIPEIERHIAVAEASVQTRETLGSQRVLQFGGEPIFKHNARLYNCFSKETKFITSEGTKSFQDYQHDDTISVLTHTGSWKPATVKCYGKQTLVPLQISRNGSQHIVWATENHRWIRKNGEDTTSLKVGDDLAFAPNTHKEFDYDTATPLEKLYWCYGMVFGDGTRVKYNGEHQYSMIRLCGYDAKYASRFEEMGFKTSTNTSLNGDFFAYTGKYLKTAPDPAVDSPELIKAWVNGYLVADGTKSSNRTENPWCAIQVTGEQQIETVRKLFPLAGIYLVSETDLSHQVTNFGPRTQKTINFRIISGFSKYAASFRCTDKGAANGPLARLEEVWCLEVEDDHSFVLPFGLSTGNCITAYVDRPKFFQECMYLLLCGCGVGFSVQRHHIAKLPALRNTKPTESKTFTVPDNIEGWADAVGVAFSSLMRQEDKHLAPFPEYLGYNIEFNYSLIRKEGAPLSSGAKAPGPAGLKRSILLMVEVLLGALGRQLKPIEAYDIIMHGADAVISGGVRRSATIALFSPDDEEMAKAKTGNWRYENPHRGRSNNSALLLRNETTKAQFTQLMEWVRDAGEPGFVWSDSTELLVNPCVEIGMWPVLVQREPAPIYSIKPMPEEGWPKTSETSGWQACNLCEINGKAIKTPKDFYKACHAAAITGTLQAAYTDFPYLGNVSEQIIRNEALLGISITGMMDSPDILFDPEVLQAGAKIVKKTNEKIAKLIGINPAARSTCIKPAGSSSCVLGTASGIHPHHAKRYFRLVQANRQEPPLQFFSAVNPRAVETSVWDPNNVTQVITFLCEVPVGAKTKNQINALNLLEKVKLVQQNWVVPGTVLERCTQPWLRHNVSNTIHVKPGEWEGVADYIFKHRKHFAGVSLVPYSADKDYPQAPFCAVPYPQDILREYGPGSFFASGVIELALECFDGNLWEACDAIMGVKENLTALERRLIEPATKFADSHFKGDRKQMTYCLKDVYNLKRWEKLSQEYVDPDWTLMTEEHDNVAFQATLACAGGACELPGWMLDQMFDTTTDSN